MPQKIISQKNTYDKYYLQLYMIFLNSINSREIELTKLSIPFQVAETMGIKIYMFN